MDSAADLAPSPFASRDFRLYLGARFFLTLAIQIQGVAVAWHVYSLTGRALSLGFVGLAQFLPSILLALVTGDVADRFDRVRVLALCDGALVLTALGLFGIAWGGVRHPLPIYGVLVLLGTARAFAGPAGQALVPHLVPRTTLVRALAWSSTTFEVATIAGPALGGLLFAAMGEAGVYALCALLFAAATGCLVLMRTRTGRLEHGAHGWERLSAGLRFVWRQKVVLGAISLDLFAVLLGGATALLPIFAREVLHTGPWGLGLLRSAPAMGAALTAFFLAHHPLRRHAGRRMLLAVALFGLATVTFALSHALWLTMAALAVLGASDMVSVVVRSTLVQLATPEEMRGRVSAVNMVFVGASNEFGEFESGVTAEWLGAVRAAVIGGLGTLLVVAFWAWRFPQLRRVDRLEDVKPEPVR